MKTSVVSQKFIVSQMRLDGSFHLSDGLIVRKTIQNSPYGYKLISDVTNDIYCPGIFRRNYVSSGTSFLGGADIQKLDLDSGKYLRKNNTPNYEILEIKKGWTLVTCGGTIGDTVFANNLLAKCWVSQHVMRVIPSTIKEGMLYAYLASKYGKMLLTTNTYGSVIPTLNADSIGQLPIPLFPESFQSEVDNLVQESAYEREQADFYLHKAVKLFEQYIGISNVKLKHQTASISFKSISAKFTRFDSQYQIGMSQLKQEKENYDTIKLSSVADKILVGNRGKREYVDRNGTPFLSSSDMMLANPLRQAKQIRKNSKNIDNMLVNTGDILISRSGTVGNTVIVGKTLNGVAVSEHAMKLTIDETKIAPEYVFAYFRTKQGQNSLQVLPYGSVIITLGEEFLGDIDLPILPQLIIDEIVENIKEYIRNTDLAIRNDNIAIKMVEQEIEKWNN